jgi:hypothetical protein
VDYERKAQTFGQKMSPKSIRAACAKRWRLSRARYAITGVLVDRRDPGVFVSATGGKSKISGTVRGKFDQREKGWGDRPKAVVQLLFATGKSFTVDGLREKLREFFRQEAASTT